MTNLLTLLLIMNPTIILYLFKMLFQVIKESIFIQQKKPQIIQVLSLVKLRM